MFNRFFLLDSCSIHILISVELCLKAFGFCALHKALVQPHSRTMIFAHFHMAVVFSLCFAV
ncbi:hypothetical protein Peur_061282 [Populus x canadensis]